LFLFFKKEKAFFKRKAAAFTRRELRGSAGFALSNGYKIH
jgi:hypothetical protein